MHELSIALSIVDIAEETLSKTQARQVESIELDIGKLSGVELDALEFVWEEAVRNSVLENAERIIHSIEGKCHCMECGYEGPIETRLDSCPECKQYFLQITQGKELLVKSLTVL